MDDVKPVSAEEEADVQSTPGEVEVWDWLSRLMEDDRKARRDQADDDNWDTSRKIYWGDQWDTNLPSFKIPIVVNELKTYILSEVSDLTDNPLVIYVQKDQKTSQRDEVVEESLKGEWKRRFVDLCVMEAALDSLVYPKGFIFCGAKEIETGERILDIRALPPECVLPDGDCTSDEDWNHVAIEEVVDLVEIRRRWPERGWRVKPDDAHSIKTPNASPWWQVWKRWGSGSYKGPLNAPGVGTRITGYVKARAAVVTLFIYDDETEEKIEVKKDEQGNEVLDEKGQQIVTITTTKKYPNGRMIVGANGVILYDGVNPYLGPFPVIPVDSEPTLHAFWPESTAVKSVRALAQAANKMDSMVVENAIRLNNPILVADASTGIKPGQLASIPGQILLKGPGEIKPININPLSEGQIGMGQKFRDMMARALGWSPQRLGMGNRGNVSADLTETEISQSMGLTRLRARLLHRSVSKLVTQMFYRMAQYYTNPKMIPMVSSSEWKPVKWEPIVNPSSYGIHVDPASFTMYSETMLKRMTLGLMKMGKVSTTSGLKTLGYPNAEQEGQKADQELMLRAMAKQGGKKKA